VEKGKREKKSVSNTFPVLATHRLRMELRFANSFSHTFVNGLPMVSTLNPPLNTSSSFMIYLYL